MKDFVSNVDQLIDKITRHEKDKKELCKSLRSMVIPQEFSRREGIKEDALVKPVKESDLEKVKMAAVDGGLIFKSLYGIDMILLRATGVMFEYSHGRLVLVDYHPKSAVDPTPKIYYEPFNDTEFESQANIERLKEEVRRAKEAVEKYKPDVMFLHGSVVPQYAAVPMKTSPLFTSFNEMIDAYNDLFESCIRNKANLVGIVEDSRGTRFCGILEKIIGSSKKDADRTIELLRNTKDSMLANYLLNFKERTPSFRYASVPGKIPVLKQLGEHAKDIHTFYLKNAEFDRPLRVDYMAPDGVAVELADKISSILIALSKNSTYAIPPIIVEADQRAKLNESDFDLFYSSLLGKLGNIDSLRDLRRMQRPF